VPSQETRLTELETLFTHMQRTIQELDQVVIDQARRIDLLEREMRLLSSDLRTVRDATREPRRPEDELPPHY
jgi:SlyX protein